ncbi:MAG: cytochrome c biogenesis protein CcdA [Deltaproteobacteria bacterium]|nr:cytochrome c biogenesis protein CcdA [Deltaproteobacteria bacterium]
MRRHSPRTAVVVTAAAALTCALFATPSFAADAEVDFRAGFAPGPVRVGEVSVLSIEARIPRGYHLYSMTRVPGGPLRLDIAVEAPGLEAADEWFGPAPEVALDPNFKKSVEFYAGEVTHRRAFALTTGSMGELQVKVAIKGQICDERQCILVREKLVATLAVEDGAARAERTKAPHLEGEPFPPDRRPPAAVEIRAQGAPPFGTGMLGFILIAMLAGLGALVTPCVFPMIPITVSYFSKFAKVSMRRAVTMAAIYAISIIVTFTLVGVLVSAIFGAVGMQVLSSSPWFNLFLTALLAVFAGNLFGFFEIEVPQWLVARSSAKEQALSSEGGSLFAQSAGVLFMAVTFTLVSFTCTVGFIGVVLAEAAKGNWFYPAVGMLAFSFAFALPFFLLAVFPSSAQRLRGKGGDWMVAVKVVLGFLELAGAFKFLSNVDLVWRWGVVTRPVVLACWVVIFVAAGLYLLRVYRMPGGDPTARKIGPIRALFAVALLGLAAYCATGVRGTQSMGGWLDGWLPPVAYPGDKNATGGLKWIVDDIGAGLKRGKAENKPVFVDFTGYTCTNCRYMEGSVFPKPEVRSRLERMVRVTAYTDGSYEASSQQRDYQVRRFDTAALPFYAILDPRDGSVLATFASMTNDAREYVAFLDKGLAAFARATRK